mmetsp:Transcript_2953/g.5066  ORF Transcript_2953/g.5066 Transcript_2953/m.5066 type:complete len:102 (-) Transcript_2953:321-626(-)
MAQGPALAHDDTALLHLHDCIKQRLSREQRPWTDLYQIAQRSLITICKPGLDDDTTPTPETARSAGHPMHLFQPCSDSWQSTMTGAECFSASQHSLRCSHM